MASPVGVGLHTTNDSVLNMSCEIDSTIDWQLSLSLRHLHKLVRHVTGRRRCGCLLMIFFRLSKCVRNKLVAQSCVIVRPTSVLNSFWQASGIWRYWIVIVWVFTVCLNELKVKVVSKLEFYGETLTWILAAQGCWWQTKVEFLPAEVK